MRPFSGLISVEEALNIIKNNCEPIQEVEEVSLLELLGRVAAEDILADFDVPPFRRAAVDGYAIKAQSTFTASESSPVHLKCVESVHAGDVPTKEINDKQCTEVATGAMIPDSADAVVPVEYTTNIDEKTIEIITVFAPNANVSQKGGDVKKGEKVIKKGDVFVPGRIGIVSSLNKSKVKVFRKPRVAVIPTGREIASVGEELKPGQVYDINTYTIASLVKDLGAEPIIFGIVEDKFEALEKAVLEAVKKADLITILGGSSVGERDINVDVIRKHGKVLFHGVQLKPGKPTLFGIIAKKPVLNVPGYPTSCLTNGYVMMAPIIRKMAHMPEAPKRKVKAKLSRKLVSRLGRHQFFTVRLENGLAIPAFKESGTITSIAWADGYIEIPFNVDYLEKGKEVEVTLF